MWQKCGDENIHSFPKSQDVNVFTKIVPASKSSDGKKKGESKTTRKRKSKSQPGTGKQLVSTRRIIYI